MLTPALVRNAKPGGARQEIADSVCRGLYLTVEPSGRKTWVWRYRTGPKSLHR
jgi:hypothetical protein